MKKTKQTSNALELIRKKFYAGNPQRVAELEKMRADDAVARKLVLLRKEVGLTQKELAKLAKTTPSVISRLEDADYEGHSLAMLRRIAAALDRQVEIHFVPLRPVKRPARKEHVYV